MKLRVPQSVMMGFITCLVVCTAVAVPASADTRLQVMRGRSAAKSAAPRRAAQAQPRRGGAQAKAAGVGASNCLYINSNLSPDPDFDPETEDPVVSNAVEAYAVNKQTGTLTYVGRFETGGLGDPFVGGFQQHSIISAGKYVYAVNPGDNTVSAFEVLRDCSLRLIETEPTEGNRPISLAASGNLLYVANGGHSPIQEPLPASLTGFRIEKDGSLTRLACPVVPTSEGDFGSSLADVVFNKTGDVLVVTELLPNLVNSYRVDRSGCLSSPATYPGGGGPFGALFSPSKQQQLFITTAVPELFFGTDGNRSPGLDSYSVDRNGTLSLVDFFQDYFNADDPEGSNEAIRDPCWLAMTQDGRYLWTSSFIPNELTLFRVSPQGRVTRVSVWDPEDFIPNPDTEDPLGDFLLGSTDIAVDQSGKYLYQLRVFDVASEGERALVPQIHVLRITGNWEVDGGLELVQVVDLPSDLDLAGTMGIALSGPGNGK